VIRFTTALAAAALFAASHAVGGAAEPTVPLDSCILGYPAAQTFPPDGTPASALPCPPAPRLPIRVRWGR
jgi:hypothetical protein